MFDTVIGFLSRLRKDTRGNVMAMAAAMIIPMIGLVGGAVDMSRLYAAKTRLQAACDAGALAGRRTMGAGLWAASSNAANTKAQSVFTLNFKPGAFASSNQSVIYTENAGTVTGNATAQVPMTLMRVLGLTTSTITASCTSMMVIPNTDVMFVLDTTGSMNCETARVGYTCPQGNNRGVEATNAKMKGLRTAVKCFFEALARKDTDVDCGSAPADDLSNTVQLRFGFMPYTSNVNVGKLLPNNYFADNWTYQSRIVNWAQQWAWTPGTETSTNWGSYSAAPTTASLTDQNQYSGWSSLPSSPSTITINGSTYTRRPTGTAYDSSSKCTAFNTKGTILDYTDAASTGDPSPTGSGPVYPATTQTANYSQNVDHTYVGYRYTWTSSSCRLQSSSNRTATQTRTGTATRSSITWTSYKKLSSFTYAPRSLNVSGLKAGGSNWNNTVTLPDMATTPDVTINASGSNSSSQITIASDLTATWSGCIEDAKDAQNMDGTPADEWSTIPATAYGSQIDFVPNSGSTDTLWKPALDDVIWGRYTGSNNDYYPSILATPTDYTDRNIYTSCPTEARKLQQWSTATDFDDYVDSIQSGGGTYHDIGLVWGGRFASPDGIFGAENKTTPKGASIVRHMIFMTDGDTSTIPETYGYQGVAWWDRRQTNPATAPDSTLLNAVVNARFSAICTAIKNKGIILWVVSYGGGVNSDTEDRLRQCSSDPSNPSTRFFSASNTAQLISNFQSIANQISSLRLTS